MSTVGECSATRAIAKRVCLMPTKEDWLEIFASCGANTYHSSGYASNFDNCMMSKHFANPGSDTYTSSYWTSSDANSKESWEAGYGGNIWGIGVSSQYNRDTGWIRCVFDTLKISLFLFVALLLLTACGDQNDALIEESAPEVQEVILNADAKDSSTFFVLTIQSAQSEPKVCSTFTPKVNLIDIQLRFKSSVRISHLLIKKPLSQEEHRIDFDANSVPTFSFYAFEAYSICAEHGGSVDEDESIFVQINAVSGEDDYLGASEADVAKLISSRRCEGCDFTNFDFGNFQDLSDVNLSGSNLTNAKQLPKNLTSSNFDRVNFTGVSMSDVNLNNSSLNAAILPREHFRPKSIDGASFVDVDFGFAADFRNLELKVIKGANFTGAKLEGSSFQNLTIESSTFDRANLRNASFNLVTWVGHSGLSGANVEGANFNSPSSSPIFFSRPTIQECRNGGGTWINNLNECYARWDYGSAICMNRGGFPTKNDWIDLFNSCGAKVSKNEWRGQSSVLPDKNCMKNKGFTITLGYKRYDYWTSDKNGFWPRVFILHNRLFLQIQNPFHNKGIRCVY